MTTVPRTSRVREHRPRAARVPRPRKPVDLDGSGGPRSRPGWPGQVVEAPARGLPAEPPVVRRRIIPEPRLVRTGAAAVLGMVLVAGLLGAVGGVVLLYLGTTLLQHLH